MYTHETSFQEFVPPITVKCDVMTPYGRGRVLKLDRDNAKVVLTEWRLAYGSRVNCFLSLEDLTYVKKKTFNETNSLEKIEAANEKREMAKSALANNDLAAADSLYTQACFYLQSTNNDELVDNHDRAAMIEAMIACKNNNAMTSLKLKRYKEAIQHSSEVRGGGGSGWSGWSSWSEVSAV